MVELIKSYSLYTLMYMRGYKKEARTIVVIPYNGLRKGLILRIKQCPRPYY
jgi:hypothetical protein